MREKELINQLKLLKAIEPSEKVLTKIRRDILAQIEPKNQKFSLRKFWEEIKLFFVVRPILSYGLSFAIAVVIFFGISIYIAPNQTQTFLTKSRIALTTNKYQKARLSFNLAQNEFRQFQNSDKLLEKIDNLENSINQTHQTLASLNLVGEKGKYTTLQCQELYGEFDRYLSLISASIDQALLNTTDPVSKQKLENLKSQVLDFERQTEEKIKMYKKK